MFFLVSFSLSEKKKDDKRLANQCDKQTGRACFHVRTFSLQSTNSSLPPPSYCLSPLSPSVCGRESPNFCSKQQVEPKGVHEFPISEFKVELFIFSLFFFACVICYPRLLCIHFPAVCAVCYSPSHQIFSVQPKRFSKFCLQEEKYR